MIDRIVEWKKTPSDPLTHDQWNSVNRDMLIRKLTEYEYSLYVKGKHRGTFTSLSGANRKAEEFA